MESRELRNKCDRIIQNIGEKLKENKRCIAAYLLGSASHDKLWEWSDIQIAVVLDDGYKENMYYNLLEEEFHIVVNVYTLTAFKAFIGGIHLDDFMWKAFSKCKKIFVKDFLLDELFEEAFYVGDVERQKEMLLGFSGAVYYLNKAEKNLYIKDDVENTIYFIPQIAENIALIEILMNKQIPERELIAQGKKLNGAVFEKIYDPLFEGKVSYAVTRNILENVVSYLKHNTEVVYEPILSYLKKHGNLEYFRYETREHGFGINYEWLVRCGIVERYGIPEKISFLNQAERLGYRMR